MEVDHTASDMSTATAKTVTLTKSDWNTVRVAILCYATEQRHEGNTAWSGMLQEVYAVLRDQTA